ncbi:unnamed protein product [Sphagnum troendelagicum]|uniref:Uncharacterized protein n=1 Tax=Sphagnum troendelagicum TaxID=128251 RepID=A0ABP0UT30_9BRYO
MIKQKLENRRCRNSPPCHACFHHSSPSSSSCFFSSPDLGARGSNSTEPILFPILRRSNKNMGFVVFATTTVSYRRSIVQRVSEEGKDGWRKKG